MQRGNHLCTALQTTLTPWEMIIISVKAFYGICPAASSKLSKDREWLAAFMLS